MKMPSLNNRDKYVDERENTFRYLNLLSYKLGKELEKVIAGHSIDEPFEMRHVLISIAFTQVQKLYLDLLKEDRNEI